jgi:hypothetical protein
MKLLPIVFEDGRPQLWVNPSHVTAVSRLDFDTGEEIQLRAELKVEGMPLQRVDLGTYASTSEADRAWAAFLAGFD